MAKAARNVAGLVVAVTMILAPTEAVAGDVTTGTQPAIGRVRSTDPALLAVIHRAALRSSTFRQMLETINASDAIVYVEPGACRRNERACLTAVSMAGASRMLRVKVDPNRADWDVMGSIGHELRHVIEVIAAPGVTSNAAMYFFYRNNAVHGVSGAFETREAIDAGNAVRDEVRAAMRLVTARSPFDSL